MNNIYILYYIYTLEIFLKPLKYHTRVFLTHQPINPAQYHTFTEVIIPMQTE